MINIKEFWKKRKGDIFTVILAGPGGLVGKSAVEKTLKRRRK